MLKRVPLQGVATNTFGDEDTRTRETRQGTFTITRPLPFLFHHVLKRKAQDWVATMSLRGRRHGPLRASPRHVYYTRPLPFFLSCAKEDGPARPCGTVPSGMKTRTRTTYDDKRYVPHRYSRATSFTRFELYCRGRPRIVLLKTVPTGANMLASTSAATKW